MRASFLLEIYLGATTNQPARREWCAARTSHPLLSSLTMLAWEQQETFGPAAPAAHGHTTTLLGKHKSSRLVVFGGQGQDNSMYAAPEPNGTRKNAVRQHPTRTNPTLGRLGDTYVLDLASWTWRHVPYGQDSARPARRAFHSATAVEGRVVLFGGAARREGAPEIYYQDTWLYVDDDRTWHEAWAGKVATAHGPHQPLHATCSSRTPHRVTCARQRRRATCAAALHRTATCGGATFPVWPHRKEVEMAGNVPAGRAAHSACLIEPGGSIVVFGGTNGQRPFDELWLLHVHSSRREPARPYPEPEPER
jgi:hypothetical protein